MKLINLFETKSSLTGRWVWISCEKAAISGEMEQKTLNVRAKPEMFGRHFVFCTIKPEMLGHNSRRPLGHRPVILLG